MELHLRIITLIFALIIILGILFLMIRKKTSASISLIWIVVGGLIMFLGIFPQIIEYASAFLHIYYAPTLIMIIAIVGILWLVFHFSSELSIAQTKINELAMQISLLNTDIISLNTKVEELKNQAEKNSN